MRTSSPVRATLLALLLASLAACNDSGSNDEPVVAAESANPRPAATGPTSEAGQAVGFVTLATGLPGFDGLSLPANLVFRTAAEWQAAWRGRNQAAGPAPEVDFDKYMVVGIAREGTCTGAGIAWVEQSATALTVHVWVSDPRPPGLSCAMSVNRIGHFGLVPRSSLPVNFIEQPSSAVLPAPLPAWGLALQAKAAPYINAFPRVTGLPGEDRSNCESLIVPFDVRATDGNLPPQLKVNMVVVAQYGVTSWLGQSAVGETGIVQSLGPDGKSEPVLRGVGRGCGSPQFNPDLPVTVQLSVATADGQVVLSTDANLFVAH